MRTTQLFTRTRKEVPADETARNAQLLIQAGFIHKEMAGVYAYMPLGKRVLDKISQIVREEMDAIGGQEVQMTVLQPRELWEKTDRWDDAKVDNWFKTKLISGAELGVGLTHEEPIVDAMKDFVDSYKDLPVYVYQIQTKFRNEKRAKSGLLRGREFLMKDMYSLARNQKEHDELYEKAAKAYEKVYQRLGLGKVTYRVKADGGIFTERYSDEYQTISPVGEDTLFRVPGTDEYYNEEVAPAKAPAVAHQQPAKPREDVIGKGIIGVEELAKFLGIPVEQTTKTMLFIADDDRIVAAAVRGGYEVNEIKLRKVLKANTLRLADEATVKRVTNAEVGYAGLLNLPKEVEIVVDESCAHRTNFEMGANQTDYHSINVNWGRDLPEPKEFHDIKVAKAGDHHPESSKVYELSRSIEVGNIFPLESKYTDALDVYYTNEKGQQESIIMGCYGIGISRLMGAITEAFADEKGLVWPENIAPAQIYLASVGNDETVTKAADKLYESLQNEGVEVLYDDRATRPGEKFADADLIGLPYRLVVSAKSLEQGKVELKARTSQTVQLLSSHEVIEKMKGKAASD